MNMPSIRISPWAKLMIYITPQVRETLMAINEMIIPVKTPSIRTCGNSDNMLAPSFNPVIQPDPEAVKVYEKKYQLYKKALASLDGLWDDMQALVEGA